MSKIIVPGKEIVVPRIVVRPLLPPPPNLSARLEPQHLHWQVGRYKERLTSGPGGLGRGKIWFVEKEAEQHNLILNQTYDSLIGQYGFFALVSYAVVGTGSTPPDSTQRGLVNEVARTNMNPGGSSISEPTAGQADIVAVREFSEAQVGGKNLTEWGFSPASSAGGNLICRELFRDGLGNPVVLTLDTDQRLRLIYKLRFNYTPAIGTAQDVSININNLGTKTGKFFFSKYRVSFINDLGHIYLLDQLAGWYVGNPTTWGLFNSVVDVATTPSATAAAGNFGQNGTNIGNLGTKLITRGRKINPRTFLNTEANITWYGIKLFRAIADVIEGQAVLAFDSGQQFTKSDLYKLTVGEWTLIWGP